jgi:hypothetical protein
MKAILANMGTLAAHEEGPQPRCGWPDFRTMTQGSRVAATLGFEPESRWDSLPGSLDIFPGLAGGLKAHNVTARAGASFASGGPGSAW